MTDYLKYINALRKCAKEHENDRTSTGHIIVSDLCRDTANLLEELSSSGKPNKSENPTSSTPNNNLGVDYIDRQDTLDAIIKRLGIKNETYLLEAERVIYQQILAMPSVTSQEPKWIPVSEKLPELFTFVNATCRSLVDDRDNWVVETIYLPIPKEVNKYGYSDWGNIPMLNLGEAEVIAWVERIIPQPYKLESEPQERDIEKCKPCINYSDGCEEWAGCPCVYYKSKR